MSEITQLIPKYRTEWKTISEEIIRGKIAKIELKDVYRTILTTGAASIMLCLISLFINPSQFIALGKVVNPKFEPNLTYFALDFIWISIPVIFIMVFVILAFKCNAELRNEIYSNVVTESSLTRIIDKYSGIVDGIGTALPLLGAAILLISIATDSDKGSLLGYAIPFEIKAIIVLAMAKLFDPVFDALALRYQEIQEDLNNDEKIFYHLKEQESLIDYINIPERIEMSSSIPPEYLDKLNNIYQNLKTFSDNLSKKEVKETFDVIKIIAGK